MSAPPRPSIPKLSELDLAIDAAGLSLRPFTDEDVDAIFPIVSQRDFPRNMSWAAHASREVTADWVKSLGAGLAANTSVTWAIVPARGELAGKAAGCVGLETIRWHIGALRVDRAELGYWLAPALWNQGHMTEAANAVVRFAFEAIGLHKLTTRCFEDNQASRRVIEKVGFRFVGRAEDDVWRDGRWHTHLVYELTSPEWPDVHTTMPISRPRLT